MTPERSSFAVVPRSDVIRFDLGSPRANKNRLVKAHKNRSLNTRDAGRELVTNMQKKKFRCGESNPDLLGESEKS
jgi:hypothetical protein